MVGSSSQKRFSFLLLATVYLVVLPTTVCFADLEAYWPLDESTGLVAADTSGNDNDLSLSGFAGDDSQWVAAENSGGLLCDGADDHGLISDGALAGMLPASSTSPADDFSIALWVQPDSATGRHPLVAKQSEPERGFVLMIEDGKVVYECWPTGAASSSALTSSASIVAGAFVHIALTYDATTDTSALYLNGVLDTEISSFGGPPRANSQELNLARYFWNGSYNWHFDGILDEVRFYSHALSTADVQFLAEFNQPPVANAGTDQLLIWPDNEASLNATVQDDGLPLDPGQTSLLWEKLSGPGAVDFAPSEFVEDPVATFSMPGVYELQLTADDGELLDSDTITIEVASSELTEGSGTAEDPFLVWSSLQLHGIGSDPNLWDKHFRQTADIDMSLYYGNATTDQNNIIGSAAQPFSGVYDGAGDVIDNFRLRRAANELGLFGVIDGPDAAVRGVVLTDVNVVGTGGEGLETSPTGYYLGGLAAKVLLGTIEDCSVDGDVRGFDIIGGLVGQNAGLIRNCQSTANARSHANTYPRRYAGGLVGFNEGTVRDSHVTYPATSDGGTVGNRSGLAGRNAGLIEWCDVNGSGISCSGAASGLVQQNDGGGVIQFCSASTSFAINGEAVSGGLVYTNSGTIYKCFTTMDVRSGLGDAGGLVARNNSPGVIEDCYTRGDVSTTWSSGNGGGGIVGSSGSGGTVRRCYAVGLLEGKYGRGGIVGTGSGRVTASFWNSDTTPCGPQLPWVCVNSGEPKTTAEMQTLSTYTDTGWDFCSVWRIDEGNDYPRLAWEADAPLTGTAPVVEVGPDRSVDKNNETLALDPFICDDGLPLDPGRLTLLWESLSGPGEATFEPNAFVADPVVQFETAGTYVLQLTADDGENITTDSLTIQVFEGTPLPLAHWPLDEPNGLTATDIADSHDGTLINFNLADPNSSWIPGQINGALQFDGTDDYVEAIGYKGVTGKQPRTVMAWMKADAPHQGVIAIWGDNAIGGKWQIQAQNFPANLPGALQVTLSNGYVTGTRNICDGNWHHVAVVLDPADPENPRATDVRLYVDGFLEPVASIIDVAIDTSAGFDLRLGSRFDDIAFLNGELDDVRIYDRALSVVQINTIAGLPNTAPVVDAGADRTILWPANAVDLDPFVTDDGFPLDPGHVTLLWEKLSGPGGVAFEPNAFVANPHVILSAEGVYQLRLTADDGELQNSDTIVVSTLSLQADVNVDGIVNWMDYALLTGDWNTIIQDANGVIPQGTAVVDGDLSDWDDALWMKLNQVYYQNPQDIADAAFSLRWNDQANRIYLAARVRDTDHVLSDVYDHWNASDRLEVYCQGNGQDLSGWLGIYDTAQQYYLAPDTAGSGWASWALGETVDPNALLDYAVQIKGDWIFYEAAMTAFAQYGHFNGEPTTVVDLEPGHVVGLDVIALTRHADGYGMLAENLISGKSNNAANFSKYTLVEEYGSFGLCANPDVHDVNQDCVINMVDLNIMIDRWLDSIMVE